MTKSNRATLQALLHSIQNILLWLLCSSETALLAWHHSWLAFGIPPIYVLLAMRFMESTK